MTRAWFASLRLVLVWFLIPTAAALADVAAKDPDQLAPAREVYRSVNERLASAPGDQEFLCNSDDRSGWRRVEQKPAELGPGCWSLLTLYRVDGSVRKAVLDEGSESGDSTSTVEHYFFPSGRTAFRFERLSTTHGGQPGGTPWPPGPYVVETRTYFAGAGKKIREVKKAYVEASGVRVAERFIEQFETVRFKSTADLPRPKGAQ